MLKIFNVLLLFIIVPNILFSQIQKSDIELTDLLDALKDEIVITKAQMLLDSKQYTYSIVIDEYENDSLVWSHNFLDNDSFDFKSSDDSKLQDSVLLRFINKKTSDSTYSISLTINLYSTISIELLTQLSEYGYFWRIQKADSISKDKTPIGVLSKPFKMKLKNNTTVTRSCLWGGADNLRKFTEHIYVFSLVREKKGLNKIE